MIDNITNEYKDTFEFKYLNQNAKIEQGKEAPYISFNTLSNIDFIKHGFSTKLGGVSLDHLSSMNLSFARGDKKENVLENFTRICKSMDVALSSLVFSDQVHGTKIHRVTAVDKGKGILFDSDLKGIDGLITNVSDITLVTFYADCVPLYFVDIKNKAIGLSHSGWRGTVGKIGHKTLIEMEDAFGTRVEDVKVVIGPSICSSCYEVSEDVALEFRGLFNKDIFDLVVTAKENGKYLLDLWLANKYILLDAGVLEKNISIANICTCCNSRLLYSHRATNGMRGNLAAFLSLI